MAANTKNAAEAKAQEEHAKKLEEFYAEKVPVYVRRPEGSKDNFFTVTVNGKNYQIKYNTEVMVPRAVKLIIDESDRNSEIAADRAIKAAEKFRQGIAAFEA